MFDTHKTRMIGLTCGEKNSNNIWSSLHRIPERNGRTDRQTDGPTELLYQYRASVCWRPVKTELSIGIQQHVTLSAMLMRDIDIAFYLSICHIQFAILMPNTIDWHVFDWHCMYCLTFITHTVIYEKTIITSIFGNQQAPLQLIFKQPLCNTRTVTKL